MLFGKVLLEKTEKIKQSSSNRSSSFMAMVDETTFVEVPTKQMKQD